MPQGVPRCLEAPRESRAGGLVIDTGATVRAAGGIVTRAAPGGRTEVLLVHRSAYDDWSFPKGKADPGESDEECALREVEEETGLRCSLGAEVGRTSYVDPKGRPKVVRYFSMRPADGELALLHEVDDARWLPLDEAGATLSYERDRALLDAVDQPGPIPGTVGN